MADTEKWANADAPPGGDGSELSPYDSLAVWNSNNAGPIAAGDRHIVNFKTGTKDDTSYLDLSGWSGAGELIIRRWPGAPSAVLRPSGGVGHAIETSTILTTLEHFDIDMSGMTGSSEEGVRFGSSGVARRLRIRDGSVSQMEGITFGSSATIDTIRIENCQISGMNRSAVLNQSRANKTIIVVNTSVYNCMTSSNNNEYAVVGFQSTRDISPASTMTVINCPVHCATSNCFRQAKSGGTYTDSDNNVANDSSANLVGPNSVGNVIFQQGGGGTGRAMFVSLSPVVDMHIIDDAGNICRDGGVGPADPALGTFVPTTDYDGDPRSGLTCDIGFDEIPTGGTELFLDASLNLSAGVGAGKIGEFPLDSALTANAGLSGQTLGEFPIDATLAANAGLSGQTLGEFPVDVTLAANAGLSGQTLGEFPVDATLAANAGLSGDLGLILDCDATLTANAGLSGEGETGIFFDATLALSVGLSGQALGEFPVDATLTANAGLSGQALGEFPVDATLQLDASIQADLTSDMLLDGKIDAVTGLTADRNLDFDLIVPKSRILCVEGQDRILRVEYQDRILRVEE